MKYNRRNSRIVTVSDSRHSYNRRAVVARVRDAHRKAIK